jgi:uncharacterized protein YdeI (YjbR/CyaY-like superfamily)
METVDNRVDAYIEKSTEFARPILNHIRELVHRASPQITETIKWGFPHFDYKGTVCSMASFKQHCAFGFWKSSLLPDPQGVLNSETEAAMGQFGRISSLADLPADDILIQFIRDAVLLNETGAKISSKKTETKKTDLEIPGYLIEALSKNPLAESYFNKSAYSHKKEYVEWIAGAKTESTRQKRMETALEWLSEGKSRNWKYERKTG